MNTPKEIFKQYKEARQYKNSLGEKGMYMQNRINDRFYMGDQWYGANVSADRPLVRHNIIKRIGEYKMGDIISKNINLSFLAQGVSLTAEDIKDSEENRKIAATGKFKFKDKADAKEIRLLSDALSSFYKATAYRLRFKEKLCQLLKNSFITGTGVLYTYWDNNADYMRGDISCEVLPVENLYFGDNSEDILENQPYIILVTHVDIDSLKRTAKACGGEVSLIAPDSYSSNKATVYTKLYKEYMDGNYKIMATSVTEKAVVRPVYDTHLTRYPISIFAWDKRENFIFGESEVTHLIPNQIAINRMLTASVWASMCMGMPIMTVNGDTVTGEITNDPGQIIKVYGSNEDVKGAVNFVSPPDFTANFSESVSSLITNTLEGSGAGMTTLGRISYNNTAAIESLSNVSGVSQLSLFTRYCSFLEETALIWLDFWINKYGKRDIVIEDENGRWYFPFDAERYKGIRFFAKTMEEKENDNS